MIRGGEDFFQQFTRQSEHVWDQPGRQLQTSADLDCVRVSVCVGFRGTYTYILLQGPSTDIVNNMANSFYG